VAVDVARKITLTALLRTVPLHPDMNRIVKLVTFNSAKNTANRVGLLINDTKVFDLANASKYVSNAAIPTSVLSLIEKNGDNTAVDSLKRIVDKGVADADLVNLDEVTLQAPIPLPHRNVICVGKNYLDHVAEVAAAHAAKDGVSGPAVGVELPKYAQFFTKAPQCVIGTGAAVQAHAAVTRVLDYEVELAVIIGTKGRDISKQNALKHVFGYSVANDITARDVQKKHNQWFKGKSLDSTCPLGPCIVPASQLDPSNLAIKMWVNGELRQNSRTNNMIFDVPTIIEQLSAGFTLYPGDIILTGTPHGVGFAMKPPQVLKAGDLMEAEIEGIGRISNRVVE
jgi:2-keto-4-pentenoate hydratase/2-oxohepta-3-ene-1,7-dioic acid hydratase in catechol pathway